MTDDDGQEVRYRGLKVAGLLVCVLVGARLIFASLESFPMLCCRSLADVLYAAEALPYLALGPVAFGGGIYVLVMTRGLRRKPQRGTMEFITYLVVSVGVLVFIMFVLFKLGLTD